MHGRDRRQRTVRSLSEFVDPRIYCTVRLIGPDQVDIDWRLRRVQKLLGRWCQSRTVWMSGRCGRGSLDIGPRSGAEDGARTISKSGIGSQGRAATSQWYWIARESPIREVQGTSYVAEPRSPTAVQGREIKLRGFPAKQTGPWSSHFSKALVPLKRIRYRV